MRNLALTFSVVLLCGCGSDPSANITAENESSDLSQLSANSAAEPQNPSGNVAQGGRADPSLAGELDPALQPPPVQPLVYADFQDRILSGRGCSFSSSEDQLLFVATSPGEASERVPGAIKVSGRVELVRANRAGGYEALSRGQTFSNDTGLGVFIRRGEGGGRRTGEEVTSWPAAMVVSTEGGGSVTFEGRWDCGA